jgi:chemotaxis protein methyltransferase CheR
VPSSTEAGQLDEAERDLLELLLHDYGYDFRRVAVPWLKLRLRERIAAEQLQTVRGLREKALHDEACRQRLLRGLAFDASAMFHPPDFYRAFAERVVPLLRTYPFIRLWQVGCSTGEEVYSMSILLEEAGLYDRSRIYATDRDARLLRQARDGIYPLAAMQEYTANYQQAGGRSAFSEYYTASYGHAIFRPSLRKNLIFAQHDLTTDGPFNDFHVIVCRGGLQELPSAGRSRAARLFEDSLIRFGFLCLGPDESAARLAALDYTSFDEAGRILRRVH